MIQHSTIFSQVWSHFWRSLFKRYFCFRLDFFVKSKWKKKNLKTKILMISTIFHGFTSQIKLVRKESFLGNSKRNIRKLKLSFRTVCSVQKRWCTSQVLSKKSPDEENRRKEKLKEKKKSLCISTVMTWLRHDYSIVTNHASMGFH